MKVLIVGVIVVVLIAIAGAAYFTFRKPEEFNGGTPDYVEMNSEASSEASQKIEISDSKAIDSNLAIGSDTQTRSGYQDFSEGTFDLEAGKKTRILFFYADWCPTCRPVDSEIKANLDKIPNDIEIIKVNYNDDFTDDSEKDLAEKYGITYQHTFVRVDSAGNEADKWNGGDFQKLLTYIKEVSATADGKNLWRTF